MYSVLNTTPSLRLLEVVNSFITFKGVVINAWLIAEGHRYLRLSNHAYDGKRGYFMYKDGIIYGYVPSCE
jgi:hypothetical protein